MQVEYRQLVDFSGYRIGDDGSVWTRRSSRGLGYGMGTVSVMLKTWHRMKPSPNHKGYLGATLVSDSGESKRFTVHKLVLLAFVGPCPPGKQCRHLDDDKSNNSADNLRWGTPLENAADRQAAGTYRRGESCHLAKLTEADVIKIRQAAGSCSAIGRRFGVTHQAVKAIRERRTWRHVA